LEIEREGMGMKIEGMRIKTKEIGEWNGERGVG